MSLRLAVIIILAFSLGIVSGQALQDRHKADAAWCSVLGRIPAWTIGDGMVCEP